MRLDLGVLGQLATMLAFFATAAAAADVQQLAGALSAGSPAERQAAADALADLGPDGREGVPALITALSSSEGDLRWRSARALGVIGDPQAVKALCTATGDAEAMVRAQAIFALARLKSNDEAAVQSVVSHLSDPDAQVRRAAVRALRLIEAPRATITPLIVKLLDDAEPTVAMRALSSIADGGVEVIPALTAALAQRDARYWACLALGEMGPQARAAAAGLIKALEDDRPEVRLQAALALGEIGPDAKPGVEAISKLVEDPFPSVRAAAVFALGRIGDPAAAASLAAAENSTEPIIKMLAIWGLAKLYPSDQGRIAKAIGLLVEALGDKNRETSQLAAKALEDLRPGAELLKPLVDKLILTKPETAERVLAAYAPLAGGAVPHAIEGLKDPQRRVRSLQILGRIGPESAPAVAALVEVLQAGDAATKTEALYTLGAIGPGAAAAVPTIANQIGDSDPRVVQAAAIALGKIGPAAKEAVPVLATLNPSKDELLRLLSVWAILKIGPPSEALTRAALPILSGALKSEREFVRIEAATTLGELGRGAAPALPALEAAGNDSSAAVRSAAASAATKIKG